MPLGAWPEAGGVDILVEGVTVGKSWLCLCFVSHLPGRLKRISGNTFPVHRRRPPTLIKRLSQASGEQGFGLAV